MRGLMRQVAVALVVALLVVGFAWAPVRAAEYPQVAGLIPFSAEAKFMSLPGYLRYLVFQQNGIWISRAEAVRIVAQQGGQVRAVRVKPTTTTPPNRAPSTGY